MTFEETRDDLRLDMMEKNVVILTLITGKTLYGTIVDIIGDKFELISPDGVLQKDCISAIEFYYLD